ncbi:MAG: 16S rRNA (guanine(527)-N(7))-methyltransferase RsmG [Bacilli bacterium]|nr:16S rRNA (guanine(527)-N(7))-methyltransferase RsmG [Bacilli bacterium]
MNKEEFEEEVKNLGINLNEEQKEQLEKFYEILIEENKKINLTRIIEKEDVYLKHFYDSLTIVKETNLKEVKTLCDVGSGAGLPGIVLKIIYPHLKVTLLDSLLKRVNYLNESIKKLKLENIEAIHTRSENYQGQFDVVTSRAVANLKKLIPWCIHLVKENGMFIAMKGNIEEETIDINQLLKKYHCEIKKINKFVLPKENSNRALVVIKKSNH